MQVGDRTEVLKPDAVVLATGMRERAIPFPGWTLPGVMFAGGAQAILKAQRTSPGRIAVVAGCGPLPIVVASQLTRAGTKVAALASLRSPLAILRSPSGVWHGRDIMREGVRYVFGNPGTTRPTRFLDFPLRANLPSRSILRRTCDGRREDNAVSS